MPMKLYQVEVTIEVYVAADSEQEARDIGMDGAAEELANGNGRARARLEQHGVDRAWSDAIPYGKQEIEQTCMQMFQAQKAT